MVAVTWNVPEDNPIISVYIAMFTRSRKRKKRFTLKCSTVLKVNTIWLGRKSDLSVVVVSIEWYVLSNSIFFHIIWNIVECRRFSLLTSEMWFFFPFMYLSADNTAQYSPPPLHPLQDPAFHVGWLWSVFVLCVFDHEWRQRRQGEPGMHLDEPCLLSP